MQPKNGTVYENEDGTLKYVADPNFTGTDEFWYWVEDNQGNFTKTNVQVTVEV
ncbi:MAG: Ig-like domain-containing protein [Hyphococcus sp.]